MRTSPQPFCLVLFECFILCIWVFACLYVCGPHLYSAWGGQARKGHQVPRRLCPTMWVLGITHWSSARALTCRDVKSLPTSCVCLFCSCSCSFPSPSLQHLPSRPTQAHTNNSLHHAWCGYSFQVYCYISFHVFPG